MNDNDLNICVFDDPKYLNFHAKNGPLNKMQFLLLLFLKSFGTNSFGMTQFHAWLLCGFMKARRDLNEN